MTVAAIRMLTLAIVEAGVPVGDVEVTHALHQGLGGARKVIAVGVTRPQQMQRAVDAIAMYVPGAPILERGPLELYVGAVRVPPAVPLAELPQWQHSSPSGGFVGSVWINATRLHRGHVVRWRGDWSAVLMVDRNPVKALLLDQFGGQEWAVRHSDAGLEVRTDMRIAPEDVP